MRIGVLGAGAVGGTLAALLAARGHDLEITARGDHLTAIRRHGLLLQGAWGDTVSRPYSGERLQRPPEVVFLTTKAQDAEQALRDNAELIGRVPLVVVQNGLDGPRLAERLVPRASIVGGLALFAASYLSPGVVTVTAAGAIYLGTLSHDDVPARFVAGLFGDRPPAVITPNLVGAQWTKLVVNQVNALPAITGLSVQQCVAHPALRRILSASIRECVRTGQAAGVQFEALQGLAPGLLKLVSLAPLSIGAALPRAMARRMGDVPNPGSTLQSIRRGQRTEIDHLNGAVVRSARERGRDAPVNAALVELVHEVEETGRFLLPAEVRRRVPV